MAAAEIPSGSDSLGAVSSESRMCSEIGIDLLKMGVSWRDFVLQRYINHMTD